MRFGVEQECFIFRRDRGVPTHADIDRLYDQFCRQGFFISHRQANSGQLLAASWEGSGGTIRVSNDFATHILEVAYPPYERLIDFHQAYHRITARLSDASETVGLAIDREQAALALLPDPIFLRPSPTDQAGRRLDSVISRPHIPSKHFHPLFPAAVAATHIHCEMPAQQAETLIAPLSELDWIIPFAFSRSPTCLGLHCHSARALCFQENYTNTPAHGIDRRENTTPANRSLLAIRTQTLEFRSADAQPNIERLSELVSIRYAMIEAAISESIPSAGPGVSFLGACRGEPSPQWPDHLSALDRASSRLPSDHQANVAITLDRIRTTIANRRLPAQVRGS